MSRIERGGGGVRDSAMRSWDRRLAHRGKRGELLRGWGKGNGLREKGAGPFGMNGMAALSTIVAREDKGGLG